MLRLFFNTLTPDDKYSLRNRDSVTQPIQMQLSKNLKGFSPLFSAFLKSILNFEHFQKKMTLIANIFPQLPTPKKVVRSMSKGSRLRGPSKEQHRKWVQILLRSERQHIDHIY